ncbi:IclR family transcriptional regulator [Reyranella sp.]|uniref:IclR family transcriptional regulator n=1 Tax=Reyranella sp. TaxID=1929291 RepID=UPI003D10FD59
MNSVDNVAKVLRLFTPDRSVLSVTEVSQLLALPKSSSSRLLKGMAEAGLLAVTELGAGYSVGNLIFETSRRHRAHSTLSVAADEALAQIVKATGHTGYIAMLDCIEVLGLRMRPGSKPLRVVTSPGDRLPAFCSSTGRAMLARLDDEAVRALYPTPWQPPSPNAPQTIDDLFAALATVREKGWSQATDEILPGVESIAVCVDDRESGERVALCISYSAAMISANEKSRIVTLLMRAGCEIGMKFDDEHWAAPRFAAFSAPSWNEAA